MSEISGANEMATRAVGHGHISVVTPTLRRPEEVGGLLENLSQQTLLPTEVILVDGAPAGENATEKVVATAAPAMPFAVRYLRHGGGTAIQRNKGIDVANGDFIAFLDDDVRPDPDYLDAMLTAFAEDHDHEVGGIVGYRKNQYFHPEGVQRWRWYRRLRLYTTFEPGRYDFETGFPVNANMQAPFSGVRPVDFMTTACAVWRREVFEAGLRFDPFFVNYGILEDAHFSLRAGRSWHLLQCGDARCEELHAPHGRENHRTIGYKCVVNYYYVFQDIAGPLTWRRKRRFWQLQTFELLRLLASAVRRRRKRDWEELRGRLEGFAAVLTGRYADAGRHHASSN